MTFRKAIALILILALLGGGGYYLLKTEREDDERMRNLYSEVEPLERERESLALEKKNLETDYALKMRDYGTVEILFTTLDAQIFTDVWGAKRLGMRNILTDPIDPHEEIQIVLKRYLERIVLHYYQKRLKRRRGGE